MHSNSIQVYFKNPLFPQSSKGFPCSLGSYKGEGVTKVGWKGVFRIEMKAKRILKGPNSKDRTALSLFQLWLFHPSKSYCRHTHMPFLNLTTKLAFDNDKPWLRNFEGFFCAGHRSKLFMLRQIVLRCSCNMLVMLYCIVTSIKFMST